MNEPRQALLTGAAFAGDQDGGIDLRNAARQVQRPKHCGTRSGKTGRHFEIGLSQGPP